MMNAEQVQKEYNFIEELKKAQKIDDNLSIRLSFDRKELRVILTDGSGCIELTKKQFLLLQDYAFLE